MFIKIEKQPKFAIRLFNRNLLEITNHKLMKITLSQLFENRIEEFENLKFKLIDDSNIDKLENDSYKVKDLKKIHKKNGDLSFGVAAVVNGEIAGMTWALLPGAKDNHYNNKNSDLYLHHVYVFPQFRGNRIIKHLFCEVCRVAEANGLKTDIITLAVRNNNISAIKAYKRMGFKTYSNKKFITVGKWNIPQFNI